MSTVLNIEKPIGAEVLIGTKLYGGNLIAIWQTKVGDLKVQVTSVKEWIK